MGNSSINLNSNFKNTYDFLKEKGYYDEIISQMAKSLQICKKTIIRAGEVYSYKGETGELGEFQINPIDFSVIEFNDAVKLVEMMTKEQRRDMAEGKNYFVVSRSRDIGGNIWLGDMNISFPEDKLPDYLKKYVE